MPSRQRRGVPWATPTDPGVLIQKGVELKNDASLLDILRRSAPPRADFAHTLPAEHSLADDHAPLFDALGVASMRASLVDLESMHCTHAWHITEAGETVEDTSDSEIDRSLPTAMATIVKLTPAGMAETQTRRLDPLSWAFAWLIEGRQVVVVEVLYRMARSDHSAADVVRIRQVCDAGMREALADAAGAALDLDLRSDGAIGPPALPEDRPERKLVPAHASKPVPAATATPPRSARAWLGVPQPVVLTALALGLLMAGILWALLQSATSLRTESAHLQAKADATMKQRVGKALAEGDYGEVQAELAQFATLKYFESALVTNTRGRVIAAVGLIQGMRMGDPLGAGVAGGARVIELNDTSGRKGQLLVWERAALGAPDLGGTRLSSNAMLIGFGAAAAAAVAATLLWQRRQRRGDRQC